MTVNDRFDILMKRLGLNANSMATALGFAGPVIYNIIGGRKSKPSYDLLNSIKMKYPQIDLNWLVSNSGDIEVGTHIVDEPRQVYKPSNAKQDHNVPIVQHNGGIDILRAMEKNEPIGITDCVTLPKWMLKPGTHIALQIRGLSMQDVLHDGSYVVLRMIDRSNWSQFVNGNIYLVYTESYGIQIKYVKRNDRNPSFLILESENGTENSAIHIHFNEIIHLWCVTASINFKFKSSRKDITEKINSLEMSYFDIMITVDELNDKINGILDKKSA